MLHGGWGTKCYMVARVLADSFLSISYCFECFFFPSNKRTNVISQSTNNQESLVRLEHPVCPPPTRPPFPPQSPMSPACSLVLTPNRVSSPCFSWCQEVRLDKLDDGSLPLCRVIVSLIPKLTSPLPGDSQNWTSHLITCTVCPFPSSKHPAYLKGKDPVSTLAIKVITINLV